MNEEELQRAAARLYQDPLFEIVLGKLTNDVMREWATTAPDDKDTRETCYHKQFALVQLSAEVKNLAKM